MKRLEQLGVKYPDNYLETLIRKYRKRRIKYPKILQRLGEPNIRKHFAYEKILSDPGRFLDYGCGTGDDIRAIVKDGYPLELITGYDIDNSNVQLGFDFYLDQDQFQQNLVISHEFTMNPDSFDIVYSGSILHVLKTHQMIENYLVNVFRVLKGNGILFGSTLGANHKGGLLPKQTLHRLTQKELESIFTHIEFKDIEIQTHDKENHERLWFFARK